MLEFKCQGFRTDGERLYRLVIDGRVIEEGMTIDQVIEEIYREDEARARGAVVSRTIKNS